MLFTRYPEGKTRALTLSYDDGCRFDRRLAGLLDQYGLRATFNLVSGCLGREGYVAAKEVASLYQNHEVAVHTVHHYDLTALPMPAAVKEILDCREALEQLTGYAVRGMSYPYGGSNEQIRAMLPALGIAYARIGPLADDFRISPDLYRWQGNSRNFGHLMETGRRFLEAKGLNDWSLKLMYVWGHSFEFDRDGNWEVMEDFCRMMAGSDDIWYATNIEIADYLEALHRLQFTADCKRVFNPSGRDVWLGVDGKAVRVPAGSGTSL